MSTHVSFPPLAINGGPKVRTMPMPIREAFGEAEEAAVLEVVRHFRERRQDPPYQGPFEQKLCAAFSDFLGGGYADAVATGTGACFVALAALRLPEGSEVIMSPVSDSGPLNSILMQGFKAVIADSAPDSYNMGVDQFLARVTPRTKAVMAVHAAGAPLEIDRLVEEAHKRGIKVIEDCSQAPGATWKGRQVGSFGDVAAFSTMYRKTLHSGGSGGIVYAPTEEVYHNILAAADRGKPVWRTDIDLRNPGYAVFPALNWNTDEISSAIATASLRRLPEAVKQRQAFLRRLIALMAERGLKVCRPYEFNEGFSPFYFPIFVDVSRIKGSKTQFAEAVQAEGIDLGAHYGCIVAEWEYCRDYLDGFMTVNAVSTRDRSFNLYVNERYGEQEAQDVVGALAKVEAHLAL